MRHGGFHNNRNSTPWLSVRTHPFPLPNEARQTYCRKLNMLKHASISHAVYGCLCQCKCGASHPITSKYCPGITSHLCSYLPHRLYSSYECVCGWSECNSVTRPYSQLIPTLGQNLYILLSWPLSHLYSPRNEYKLNYGGFITWYFLLSIYKYSSIQRGLCEVVCEWVLTWIFAYSSHGSSNAYHGYYR